MENGNAIQCFVTPRIRAHLFPGKPFKVQIVETEDGEKVIGTKAFALEQGDRFLAWDYCYLKLRGAIFGSVEESSLEAISERTGHDQRWAYKVVNNLQRRLRNQEE